MKPVRMDLILDIILVILGCQLGADFMECVVVILLSLSVNQIAHKGRDPSPDKRSKHPRPIKAHQMLSVQYQFAAIFNAKAPEYVCAKDAVSKDDLGSTSMHPRHFVNTVHYVYI